MSNTRNFRVAINLSNFFHDHRNRARIFINNDIQTISDLEEKIGNIFQIKNFHLISHNEFLPSAEDVRILQQDDIIWVMPNTSEQPIISKTTLVESSISENKKNKKRLVSVTERYVEEGFHPSKKKKKELCDVTKTVDEEDNILGCSEEQPKKKKKRKKDHEIDIIKDNVNITTEVGQIKHKEKKKKNILSNSSSREMSETSAKESFTQNESNTLKINTLLPVLQSHIDSYNKKIEKKNNLENSSSSLDTSAKTEWEPQAEIRNTKEPYKCKGNLSNYKKKVIIPTITDKYLQEKKVNIVKIEYLSGTPTHINKTNLSKSIHESSEANKTTSVVETSSKTITNETSCVTENKGVIESMVTDTVTDNSKIVIAIENNNTYLNNVYSNDRKSKCSINNVTSSVEDSDKITTEKIKTKRSTDDFEMENEENLINFTENVNNTNSSVNMDTKFFEIVESPIINRSVKDVADNSNCSLKNEMPCTNIDTEISSNIHKINPQIVERIILSNVNVPINEGNISLKNRQSDTYCENLCSIIEDGDCSVKIVEDVQITPENCKLQPLQNLEGTVRHVVSDLKSVQQPDESFVNIDNKTAALEVTNLETDLLNAKFASESKEELTDASVTDESTNVSDVSKYSEVHKDVTATLDQLSVSTKSNRESGSSHSRRKQISGVGQLLGELRESESLVTGESMDSDPTQEFVTKRRRKRVRKRRKKNTEQDTNSSLNDSSIIETSKYIPKPLTSKACPAVHLKFEEDGEILKAVNVTKEQSKNEKTKESSMETSILESITIESDADEPNLQNFFIKDEVILKSPCIKNSWPRVGDVIAFKYLRITENYTPEISSYIIGKVLEYDSDSKTVSYDILSGLDQCREPKGKLTTQLERNNTRKEKSSKREFLWSDLIDPRLLFP